MRQMHGPVPTGHLVFMREGVLLAVPFNPVTLKVHGDVVPILGGVAHAIGMGDTRDFSGLDNSPSRPRAASPE